jgi:DNA-binding FadR family transcriptional regulator
MTIRAVVDKLRTLGVLYSRKGSSIYVSPFYSANLVIRTEITIGANKVDVLPTAQDVPKSVLEMFQSDGIRNK